MEAKGSAVGDIQISSESGSAVQERSGFSSAAPSSFSRKLAQNHIKGGKKMGWGHP